MDSSSALRNDNLAYVKGVPKLVRFRKGCSFKGNENSVSDVKTSTSQLCGLRSSRYFTKNKLGRESRLFLGATPCCFTISVANSPCGYHCEWLVQISNANYWQKSIRPAATGNKRRWGGGTAGRRGPATAPWLDNYGRAVGNNVQRIQNGSSEVSSSIVLLPVRGPQCHDDDKKNLVRHSG